MTTSTITAFGLDLEADFALAATGPLRFGTTPRVTARLATPDERTAASTTGEVAWSTTFGDRSQVVAARLPDGGYRLDHGESSHFILGSGGTSVIVHPREPDSPAWQRFLLDTVLWWLALVHGRHVVHGAVVKLGSGELVAILGPSGAGKTTLASELVLRGARLFSDDLLCLDDSGTAHPGPPLMNVPCGRPDVGRLGTILAHFADEDELWIRVDRAASAPGRVGLLILLNRRSGERLRATRVAITPLDLFPHVWALPGDSGGASQFGALADLAGHAAVYRLDAALTDRPRDTASLIEDLVHESVARR